jgi:hypothetical protein
MSPRPSRWLGTCQDGPEGLWPRTLRRWALVATLLWSAAAKAVTAQAEPETASPPAPSAPVPPQPAPVEPVPADLGPDTLPALEDPPSLTPPPTPPPVAPPPNTERRLLPVRAERRLALLGELGWNSLGGVGPSVTFHAHPHLSFDLGAGLGAMGGKIGLRARVNVLTNEVTPFFGVGLIGGSGWEAPANIASDMENRELNIKVLPSAFFQAVAGVDWTSRDGFTLVGALGYAFLITRDSVEIITGEPTADERRGLDAAFRSSFVISIAIGYSFR